VKTEQVSLVPYDDEWPNQFKTEAKYLMGLLPEDILLEFHHIGSTSVPDMPANPVIDIGIMVTSFDEAKEKITPILTENNYEYFSSDDKNLGFMTFTKEAINDAPAYKIHFAEEENHFWDRLYFREYLKKNRDEARNYFELKDQLCKSFGNDYDSYAAGKADYVNKITAIAKEKIKDF
jgi:GrpB-like predicted nucleotidyltransferase (UPF0157 family)